MLSSSEKAYCLALTALKEKDYANAVVHFDRAADEFGTDKEFTLLRESTRLLVAVKEELGGGKPVSNDELITKE